MPSIPGLSSTLIDRALAPVLCEIGWVITVTQAVNEGGGTDDEPSKGPPVPCAIEPVGGGEFVGSGARRSSDPPGSRISDLTTHVILLPAGTEVSEEAEVEIEGRGRFEVTAVRRRSLELAREVEAREAP